MPEKKPDNNPRIIVVQKLYSYFFNKDSKIIYPKHRYKKFIKDTVSGTIEREELLLEKLKIQIMSEKQPDNNPRIIVVQKLYSYFLNKDSKIIYPKHRYKKFIKDTVSGTIEREELLLENLKIILKDEFNPSRTDLILKLMILSATFELMFSHKTPVNVIVSEYIKISDFFLETAHKGYLNAILDKVSKNVRKDSE